MTFALVQAHVALPDGVSAHLVLCVLQLINHLEDQTFLLVIEVALLHGITKQLIDLVTLVNFAAFVGNGFLRLVLFILFSRLLVATLVALRPV